MNVIATIAALGIPTRSQAAAIQHFRDHDPVWHRQTADTYQDLIIRITGVSAQSEDALELEYAFRYTVTTAIEQPDLTGHTLVNLALARAQNFIADHPYVFAEPDEDLDAPPKLDAQGKPKAKKGAKKEMARKVYDEKIRNEGLTRKESIAILVEEVGLSPAGASTYYANLKKGVM